MVSFKRDVLGKKYLSIILFTLFLSFLSVFISSSLLSHTSSAEFIESDLEITVSDVIALSLVNCDNTNSSVVSVSITPSTTGVFKSNCQTATVNTNNPGYALTIKANTSTLNYQNPTTVVPVPTIPSTTNTIATPNTLQNDTWGFAAEDRLNFDDIYIKDNQNNNYSLLPTTDETIYQTTTFPLPETSHTFYYGTKLTTGTMSGTYSTTITYTAIGEVIPPAPKTCKNHEYAPECIEFTVDVGTTGTYSIPTSGHVSSMDHTYNWDVYVDGYLTTECTGGNCAGTGAGDSPGIILTGLSSGQHQILIVPHDAPVPGWGNAFGHLETFVGANVEENTDKMISLDSPLTTMAFSPKTTESTTDASMMFSQTFAGCTNMITPIRIIDTYKLPDTITNLSSFLYLVHHGDYSLSSPIDLSQMSGWLNNNSTITDLSFFMFGAHFSSDNLATTIDLSPLENWFSNNSSITNLSYFLHSVHRYNAQSQPLDLSPLRNWFNENNSITNLSRFLNAVHLGDSNISSPIDLSPLENWFNENYSITDLLLFLTSLHADNPNLRTAVDLSPLSSWFKNNNSIIDIGLFLAYIHQDNINLIEPIDLSPLSNWFNSNTSLVGLSSLFMQVHYNNTSLVSPINLVPLSGWFASNRPAGQTVAGAFMYQAHYNNTSLDLNGQIVFPNWVKTLKNLNDVAIWGIGATATNYSFRQTYYTENAKSGDIEEVKFEDGTLLSSVGAHKNSNHQTYTGRTGITPLNNFWK